VAAHHFAAGGQIGRSARHGREDLRHVPEVSGSEHAGCSDREKLGVGAAAVLKPVDLTAPDAHGVAGADLYELAIDCPAANALETVGRLLERVVAVGAGTLACAGTVDSKTVTLPPESSASANGHQCPNPA